MGFLDREKISAYNDTPTIKGENHEHQTLDWRRTQHFQPRVSNRRQCRCRQRNRRKAGGAVNAVCNANRNRSDHLSSC